MPLDQPAHRPCRHDARAVGAGDERHRSYEPVAATTAPARISRWASASIAATMPSYQPTAVTPVRTSTPAATAAAASSWTVPGRTVACPVPRASRHRSPPPPRPARPGRRPRPPRARPAGRRAHPRRPARPARAAAAAVRARPSRPSPSQPPAPAEPAQHVQVPLAQPPRPQEPVVVERRRDPARERGPTSDSRSRSTDGRRARRARRAPRAPAPGTTGRSARHRPRTRTSRTARSSTSARADGGTGSSATGSAGPRPAGDGQRLALDALVPRGRRT